MIPRPIKPTLVIERRSLLVVRGLFPSNTAGRHRPRSRDPVDAVGRVRGPGTRTLAAVAHIRPVSRRRAQDLPQPGDRDEFASASSSVTVALTELDQDVGGATGLR